MTKNEMLSQYFRGGVENNYAEAQDRIKNAMLHGETYVYLPKEEYADEFNWVALPSTIQQLKKDGFNINGSWDPEEYWSVEWE